MTIQKNLPGDHTKATIRDLLSYKLHRTANALSRSAAVRYREQFGISIAEWRAMAVLGAESPISASRLAREADLDKGQASRVVAGLVASGLVSREPSPDHGRIVHLSLTRQGQAKYKKLMQVAWERDHAFQASLGAEQLRVLESALDKLSTIARAMSYRQEESAQREKPAGAKRSRTQAG